MNPRLEKLPKWRGFPIPFFATLRTDGTPDFKVIDEVNRKRCADERLCFICGQPLGHWIIFIGGPRSAQARTYIDGPMHPECADDAMQICPFLVGRTDYAEHIDEKRHERAIQIFPGVTAAPDEMVLYRTRSYKIAHPSKGEWLFYAAPPVALKTMQRKGG